jgi:hypothetical protein
VRRRGFPAIGGWLVGGLDRGWLLGGWLVGGWLLGGWLVGGWLDRGWLLGGWLVGGWLVGSWPVASWPAGGSGSPGMLSEIVPPPAAATGRSGVPLATSSFAGGVVRKTCCSIPATMPPTT